MPNKDSAAGRDFVRSETYSKRSSAWRETLCSMAPLRMPTMPVLSLSAIASGSIAMSKRIGLSGQPWRVPRPSLKG